MAEYQERISENLIVAAIDFGTTYSGFAFGFRDDYHKDPLKISGKQWTHGSQAGVSLKTSTCVLFTPNKEFDSFGFEAEDKYSELALEEQHENWFYFRRFKMELYDNQTVGREFEIEDDKCKKMSAMKVFSACIRYLKEELLKMVFEKAADIGEADISWVLTVPAIWTDSAKQFMRESAVKAGIPSDQLIIALEPEAAAIYCKHLPVDRVQNAQEQSTSSALANFQPGTRYMVLDAGGGTIDITVQEVQRNGNLKELYKANGGSWGGTKIDEAFEEFLVDVVGKSVMERFKKDARVDYLELCRHFEIKKRTVTPEMENKTTFKLPISLNEIYQDMKGQTSLSSSVNSANRYGDRLAWIGDKLRINSDIAKGLFKITCENIIEHLQMIFQQLEVEGTNTILMVGGFSESPMLVHAVKKRFRDKRVINPHEAGLSVLKGAVLYGFDSKIIQSRVCKYTYGICINCKFQKDIDPPEKITIVDGKTYCQDRFSRQADVGESKAVGEGTEEYIYYPLYAKQTQMTIAVYVSCEHNPRYVTESSCTYLGELMVDMPDTEGGTNRPVGVQLIFGGTELSVKATVKNKNRSTSATLDFLNHQM